MAFKLLISTTLSTLVWPILCSVIFFDKLGIRLQRFYWVAVPVLGWRGRRMVMVELFHYKPFKAFNSIWYRANVGWAKPRSENCIQQSFMYLTSNLPSKISSIFYLLQMDTGLHYQLRSFSSWFYFFLSFFVTTSGERLLIGDVSHHDL